MVRQSSFSEKLNDRRGVWTAEEDAKVLQHAPKHGIGSWSPITRRAGLKRCGKSCKLRWTNYQRSNNLNYERFSPHEEDLIVKLHATLGSRWSIIAQQLPGRTDSDVKNYWNTKLRKKLKEMGIDPVTHKPFSQIVADYGNISGLPIGETRIGSLNRELKNALMLKADQFGALPPKFQNINTHLMNEILPNSIEPESLSQESFLSNTYDHNNSFDLLDQLQSIKLVTEASNRVNIETSNIPCSHNKGGISSSISSSSWSSSSSSSSSTASQEMARNFSWRDFLLDDAFLQDNPQEQGRITDDLLLEDFVSETQKNGMMQQGIINEAEEQTLQGVPRYGIQGQMESSSGSFVEAMLNQESKMFQDFPCLSDELFFV